MSAVKKGHVEISFPPAPLTANSHTTKALNEFAVLDLSRGENMKFPNKQSPEVRGEDCRSVPL